MYINIHKEFRNNGDPNTIADLIVQLYEAYEQVMTEQDTNIKLLEIDKDLIHDKTLKQLIYGYQEALFGLNIKIENITTY